MPSRYLRQAPLRIVIVTRRTLPRVTLVARRELATSLTEIRFGEQLQVHFSGALLTEDPIRPGGRCNLRVRERLKGREAGPVGSTLRLSWLVSLRTRSGQVTASARYQTRKSPIPVPPIPDWAGNRGGNPRRAPIPVGIGRNRETGNPRFPILPGTGIAVPIGRAQIGKSGIPVCVSAACTILGWMLP